MLLWAWLSSTPFSALGLATPPRGWTIPVLEGPSFGVLLKLGLKALGIPLIGAPPVNTPYHFLAGNTAALPGMIATILVSAALGEEIPFRGFEFERLVRSSAPRRPPSGSPWSRTRRSI